MSNDNSPVRRLVREALASAKENGFDFAGMSADDIAFDMIDYDAEIADLALDACGLIDSVYKEIVAEITRLMAKVTP